MRRLWLVFASSVALLLAVTAVSAAGRSAVSLTVLHVGHPTQLVVPSDQSEFEYVLDLPETAKPTGTLYVRRDGQKPFSALPLQLGFASGHKPRLHAVLPARFTSGKRFFYYATLQDSASGATVTVPAKGAGAPEIAWILHQPIVVRLGAYRFGHTEAAETVVARAAAKDIGWKVQGQYGPYTFLVGRDRSIWLEDTVKHRMLVWRAGKPNRPVRTVPLPSEGRTDIHFQDIAFGPKGTLYVARNQRDVAGFQVFRINARTGKVLWKSSSYVSASWDGYPRAGVPLRVGIDGTLYGLLLAMDFDLLGTPDQCWMPLATPAGKPIPPAQQFTQMEWGSQPARAGGRFIAENYLPPHARYVPREMRFAIIDRHSQVLRAWRVISKTSIGEASPAQLLGGRIVADVFKLAGPGTLEHLVLRLDPKGLDAKASIPFRFWGAEQSPDLRIGRDGKIYALATSPKTGIVIRRYSLGRG